MSKPERPDPKPTARPDRFLSDEEAWACDWGAAIFVGLASVASFALTYAVNLWLGR